MADPTLREVHEAVNELHSMVETIPAERSEYKEKFEKINKVLDAQEDKNQELLVKLKSKEEKEAELLQRIEALEIEYSNGNGRTNDQITTEYKAVEKLIKEGELAAVTEYKNILRTDVETQGGYLAAEQMDNTIIKLVTEISPIRSVARVRTIDSKSMSMPIRNGIPVATYEGEAEDGGESNSTYTSETVTPYRQTTTVPVTMEQLMNSAFNMEAEVLADVAEAFSKGEGSGFVNGSGHKQPEGFLSNATLQANAVETEGSGVISADDVINLYGELKTGYNPVYGFNRRTLAKLRTVKSQDGNFLWGLGLNGSASNTLNGLPYFSAIDMPDIAAGAYSIVLGDFKRGYVVIDRTGVSIVRDDVSRKKGAVIELTFHRWNTGQVVIPECFKLLKVKV